MMLMIILRRRRRLAQQSQRATAICSMPIAPRQRQDAQVAEYLVRQAVEQRKVKRSQIKRSKRLKTARQRALNTLGFTKPPKEAKPRQSYHKLKGVYARLLEALDIRHDEATERARLFVLEREAQLAALAMMDNKGNQVGQSDKNANLKTIESIREQEVKQIQLLTNLSLSTSLNEDYDIEEMSNKDLITVLRIRGNVKGIRSKHAKRETLLGLLVKSFDAPLY